MTMQARAQMQGVVKQASDTQACETHAGTIWATLGPKTENEPVKLFDLEQALRTNLKDNLDAMKHGIAAIRERASAFNAQQAEVNAAGVNGVFGMIDKGTPLSAVRRSPEWLALPELKQHEIMKSLESEAAVRESRAAAVEQRGAAAEQRALAGEQRRDRQLLMGNGDAYLRVSDPAVLSTMTRQGVEATRTAFGFEGVQHLLQRFDSLQKPGAIAEARMDKEDFQHAAEQMGLDPFNAKTPEKKKQLGELQYRVEQLIDSAQRAKGATLLRPEKEELMRSELARTVSVGGLFSNTTTPVIQLSRSDADRVVVPQTERSAIVADMQKRYAANPGNARFAPTDANVRYWYLRSQSRAADLIPEGKP